MIRMGELPSDGMAWKIGAKKIDNKKRNPQTTVDNPVFAPSNDNIE